MEDKQLEPTKPRGLDALEDGDLTKRLVTMPDLPARSEVNIYRGRGKGDELYDPNDVVAVLIQNGYNKRKAAITLGCSFWLIGQYEQRYPELFAAGRTLAEEATRDWIKEKIFQMIADGNTPVTIFAAKALLGWSDRPDLVNKSGTGEPKTIMTIDMDYDDI